MSQVPNSYMENVVFDIYETAYDSDLNNEVINANPSISGIRGHLQDTFLQPSPDGSIIERERTATVRMICHLTEENEDYLKNGNIVNVTQRKNRRTKGWTTVSNEMYIINFISDTYAHGNFRVLSLLTKERT